MSKHRLSPAALPPPKRQHLVSLETEIRGPHLSFESLSDEVILSIFSYLSWVDLCAAQATSGNWLRLATDNELWRNLYLQVFGRSRLRGARGFVGRTDGREVKALPGRAKVEDLKDWRIMFRISMNWINGMYILSPGKESNLTKYIQVAVQQTIQNHVSKTLNLAIYS